MVLFPKYQAFDDFSEKIFIHLDLKSLNACQRVNKAWYENVNKMVKNPETWLKKCFMNKSRWSNEMDLKQESQWTLARQRWDRLVRCLMKSESNVFLKRNVIECLKDLDQKLRFIKWEKIPNFLELAPNHIAAGELCHLFSKARENLRH